MTAFLHAGVPLNKIDDFREILEENAVRLTDCRHMYDYLQFIVEEEATRICQEITGKLVSIIFDGTTRLGEAMAIVIRFISDDWQIQQRLVRVRMLSKSLSGEEIARELISVLSVSYSIRPDDLLGAMRDRAACNGVAMRTSKIIYPLLLDIGCFSHTIDNAGTKFEVPILSEFITTWISLFSHSPKA